MAGSKTAGILEDVGSELKNSPPSILTSTRRKFGPARALKQQRAILLSKARKLGAAVPAPKMAK